MHLFHAIQAQVVPLFSCYLGPGRPLFLRHPGSNLVAVFHAIQALVVPLFSCCLGLGRRAISLLSRSSFVALFRAIVAQVVPLFSRHPWPASLVVFISRHLGPGRPPIFAPSRFQPCWLYFTLSWPRSSRYFRIIHGQPRCLHFTLSRSRSSRYFWAILA